MLRSCMTLSLALLLGAGISLAAAPQLNTNVAKLRNPAALNEQAPPVYKAKFDTSAGVFVIEVHRDWAPRGADRFYNLVKNGFYDDVRIFRVVPGFMAQFGMHGVPSVQKAWMAAQIPDDPVKQSNRRGYVTFAMAGLNSRTTQVFINLVDNPNLDKYPGTSFAPFGRVVSGMDVVGKLYGAYGDSVDLGGKGPTQGRIVAEGNRYLEKEFPKLDYVKKATIEQ